MVSEAPLKVRCRLIPAALSIVLSVTVCGINADAKGWFSRAKNTSDSAPVKVADRPSESSAQLDPKEIEGATVYGETTTYPVRDNGNPFVLNIDTSVNLTDAINRFYFNPKWRGEVWSPFNDSELGERVQRMMTTWKDYDEFSEARKLNSFHKFFEKWSGYGP